MTQVSSNSLAIDSILHNKYKILKVLGEGAFGITYKALDTSLDRLCVIKEFLPTSFAVRNNSNTTVSIRSESEKDNYEWGLKSFSNEAKSLARFTHPNIVQVRTTFQENNTAYFEMPFEEGMDLEEYLETVNPDLSEQQIIDIAIPILNGLSEAHKHGILHRDIKPGNIFIRKNGMPMLIDFGAAREALGTKSHDLTQILTPPYAPAEQYQSDRAKQGAWTDIYAVGITLYKLITKKTSKEIPASTDRQSSVFVENEPDPIETPTNTKYSQKLIDAIMAMLKIRAKDRPQNCSDAIGLIMGEEELKPEPEPTSPLKSEPEPEPKKPDETIKVDNKKDEVDEDKEYRKREYKIVAGILIILLIVGFINYKIDENNAMEAKIKAEKLEKERLKKKEQKRLEKLRKEKEALKKAEDVKRIKKERAESLKEKLKKDLWNSIDIYKDKDTQLIWEDSVNTRFIPKSWTNANIYCQKLSFAKSNEWRLPNKNELNYLYAKKSKLKNLATDAKYWTSSNSIKVSSEILSVDFSSGDNYRSSKLNLNYVRCVRDTKESKGIVEIEKQSVYFDNNSYIADFSEFKKIEAVAKVLKNSDKSFNLRLEGNGSSFGDDNANFAMGLKRANNVKKVLIDVYGINSSRINVVSYGESNPFCTEHTESCQKKNRRVNFKVDVNEK